MTRKNGTPVLFNTVDTVWTSGLGKELVIPGATLVAPGDVPADSLSPLYSLSDPKKTTYKTENYSLGDVQSLRSDLSALNRKKLADFEMKANKILQPLNQDITTLLKSGPPTAALRDQFSEVSLEQRTQIENLIRNTTNELAVSRTLEYQGYKVKTADEWSWQAGEGEDISEATKKLGKEFGAATGSHAGSTYGAFEDSTKRLWNAKLFMEDVIQNKIDPTKVPETLPIEGGYYTSPNKQFIMSPETYFQMYDGVTTAPMKRISLPNGSFSRIRPICWWRSPRTTWLSSRKSPAGLSRGYRKMRPWQTTPLIGTCSSC